MTSDTKMCPRCLFEDAYCEYDIEAGEECLICCRCGYVREVKQDNVSEHKGVGAYCFITKKGTGSYGPIWEAPSEAYVQELTMRLKEPGTSGYLTRWNEETNNVEFVVGGEDDLLRYKNSSSPH